MGGTPILAVVNPLFWVMTLLWFVAQPLFVKEIFPAPVYYVGLVLWAFGNFLLWYLTVLTARHTRPEGLVLAAMLVPIYWVMMSIAALKAMWQLVDHPVLLGKDDPRARTAAPTPTPQPRSPNPSVSFRSPPGRPEDNVDLPRLTLRVSPE